MKRRFSRIGQSMPISPYGLATLILLVVGCASESPDQIAKEFLDVMNRVVAVCDQIEVVETDEMHDVKNNDADTDKSDIGKSDIGKSDIGKSDIAAIKRSAEKIKPKLASLLSELRGLESRLNSIGDVDDETKSKLSDRFQSEFESLRPKFSRSMKKLEHPAVKTILETEIKTLSSMFNAKPPR